MSRLERVLCAAAVVAAVLIGAAVSVADQTAPPANCVAQLAGVSAQAREVLERAQALEDSGDYLGAGAVLARAVREWRGRGWDRTDRSYRTDETYGADGSGGGSAADTALADVSALVVRRLELLLKLCRFAEAETTVVPLLAELDSRYGRDAAELIPVLNAVGDVHFQRGDFVQAERSHRRALVLTRHYFGTDDGFAIASLEGLARVCHKERRLMLAIDYAERSYQACAASEHATPIERAVAADCLGMVRRRTGRYPDAERLFKEALGLVEKAYGADHPMAAVYHNRLAALYVNIRKPQDAEREARLGLDIATRRVGPEHLETGNALYSLALGTMLRDSTADVSADLDRVLAIETKCLGDSHYDIAGIYGYYGFYLRLHGDIAGAFRMALKAASIRRSDYIRNSRDMIDFAALLWSQEYFYDVSDVLSYALDTHGSDTTISRLAAEEVLRAKGLTMTAMVARHRCMAESASPRAKRQLDHLQQIRTAIAALFFRDSQHKNPSTQPTIDSLEWVEQDLLGGIADLDGDCRSSTFNDTPTVDEIRDLLPPGSVFVDYINYLWVRPTKVYAEERRLAALVIDKTGLRGLVPLDVRQIDQERDPIRRLMHERTSSPPAAWSADVDSAERTLYHELWDPVAGLIAESLVFVAPAARFDPIPFGALRAPSGEYLAERYEFHYIDNAQDFIRSRESPRTSGAGLFALGDPAFDARPDERRNATVGVAEISERRPRDYAVRSVQNACREFADLHLVPLPGTRSEVLKISDNWQRTRRETATVVTGASACEEMVKWVAPGHRVIHLATHAYSLPNDCVVPDVVVPPYTTDLDALMRFGLLLAGANLKGAGAEEAGAEDGVLTAEEVSALSLDGTDLVVLSACETGAATSANDEGLGFGLRRAFRVAGARTVISSAWPVADHTTTELMDRLYSDTVNSYAAILSQYARDKIREARAQGKTPDPSEWAPFVVSGDWRR